MEEAKRLLFTGAGFMLICFIAAIAYNYPLLILIGTLGFIVSVFINTLYLFGKREETRGAIPLIILVFAVVFFMNFVFIIGNVFE